MTRCKRAVLITGALGGIGAALVDEFVAGGWRVIATDLPAEPPSHAHAFVAADLASLSADGEALKAFGALVRDQLDGAPLSLLVNNAATQCLGATADISAADWDRSIAVNLTAPFRLVQEFLEDIRKARGAVINIGSVHAQATKREFVAYATSKAAIHGLTRALAVDIGPDVRVLCLAPAAVETDMLRAGFEGRPEDFALLAEAHALKRIGKPREIARAAVAIADEPFLFATGSVVWLDGGVLSRLHDPL
jgi:NAD(P)-dependent dehydrogenase (short-subunit alcohol dehydrogenase family)